MLFLLVIELSSTWRHQVIRRGDSRGLTATEKGVSDRPFFVRWWSFMHSLRLGHLLCQQRLLTHSSAEHLILRQVRRVPEGSLRDLNLCCLGRVMKGLDGSHGDGRAVLG